MTKGFIMQSFLGTPCPYCGKNFTVEDDIVVCPECGTPHHRDCYKEHSSCANEEMHSENYEWKSAVVPPVHQHEQHQNTGRVLCSYCGKENPASSHYCNSCGAPLGVNREPRSTTPSEEFQRERERIISESLNGDLNGISAKEAAVYVRTNVGYFLPRFKAFTKGAKFDTNFSAFFFSHFYLFYRKMYGLGAAVFAATAILQIPTFLLDLVTLQEQYVQMGLISQIIWEIPHQKELAIYSLIANVLIWAIRILLMVFFNRLYFSKVVNTIKGSRENLSNQSEEKISAFFRKKGGTSMVGPIIICCLTFGVSFALAAMIVGSGYFIFP